jgi:hypothetical protein
MLSPIVPETARKVYQQLGFSDEQWSALSWDDTAWRDLPRERPAPCFVRAASMLLGGTLFERCLTFVAPFRASFTFSRQDLLKTRLVARQRMRDGGWQRRQLCFACVMHEA